MEGLESKLLSRIAKLGVEVLMVAIVMCADAFAQEQTVLTNVTVIDGTGRARRKSNRTIVIKGDTDSIDCRRLISTRHRLRLSSIYTVKRSCR